MTVRKQRGTVKHAIGWYTDGNGLSLRSLSPAIIACTGREKTDKQRRSMLDEYVTCKRTRTVRPATATIVARDPRSINSKPCSGDQGDDNDSTR